MALGASARDKCKLGRLTESPAEHADNRAASRSKPLVEGKPWWRDVAARFHPCAVAISGTPDHYLGPGHIIGQFADSDGTDRSSRSPLILLLVHKSIEQYGRMVRSPAIRPERRDHRLVYPTLHTHAAEQQPEPGEDLAGEDG